MGLIIGRIRCLQILYGKVLLLYTNGQSGKLLLFFVPTIKKHLEQRKHARTPNSFDDWTIQWSTL